MSKCAVMEQAFVGAIRGIQSRIEKAIEGQEKWIYQLGTAPSYVGNHTVLDDLEKDSDSIEMTFHRSPWDVYDYRIRIDFLEPNDTLEVMIIDVNVTDGRFNAMPDNSFGEVDACQVQMTECDGSFIFYPVEDLCTVLTGMSYITEGEVLHAAKATLKLQSEAVLEEREKRKRRFQVIEGTKGS